MTSPDHQSPAPQPPEPEFPDRVYRSSMAVAGGVALLAVMAWLGIDAIVNGDGRTPWLALAGMILAVPLVVAFTLRPAVYAGQDRLRVRNPFRVIVLPWGQVAGLRSGYSNELFTEDGRKFQLWSVPVSLRARKRAARQEARATQQRTEGRDARDPAGHGPVPRRGAPQEGPVRAATDKVMDELRELQESRAGAPSAQGEVSVRWAWEILGPALAGAVVLVIVAAMG
ncbi:PH domain-containing protein [Streptomyces sp. bgisy154]|uniref:PH domain-containing protein n=1 Tax=Streptomyces sp. bgisy154 TaxID=3413794 RepID=UPI003D71B8CD